MNFNITPLEEIQIAKPCRADWNRMTGDQRARFCGSCEKNVYDISQMKREDAYQLIAQKEGDLCLRLHRRADGTVITSDCPVGTAVTPTRPLWLAVAALMALVGSGLCGCATPAETRSDIAVVTTQSVENQPVAPIKVETPPMDFGNVESVPITNGSASTGNHEDVTMGVPMPPPPESAPTPQPTNAPLMGKFAYAPIIPEVETGDIAPIGEKP